MSSTTRSGLTRPSGSGSRRCTSSWTPGSPGSVPRAPPGWWLPATSALTRSRSGSRTRAGSASASRARRGSGCSPYGADELSKAPPMAMSSCYERTRMICRSAAVTIGPQGAHMGFADELKAKAAELLDDAKDVFEDTKDKAGDLYEGAKDKAGDLYEGAKDKAEDVFHGDTADAVKDNAADVADTAKDVTDDAAGTVTDAGDSATS